MTTATIPRPASPPGATRASLAVARRALLKYVRTPGLSVMGIVPVRAVLVQLPVRVRRRHPRRRLGLRQLPGAWPTSRRSSCSPAAASPSPSPRTARRDSPTGCSRSRCRGTPLCSGARWPTPPRTPGPSSPPPHFGFLFGFRLGGTLLDGLAALGLCLRLRDRVHARLHRHRPVRG